jgi:hypothetical protein
MGWQSDFLEFHFWADRKLVNASIKGYVDEGQFYNIIGQSTT